MYFFYKQEEKSGYYIHSYNRLSRIFRRGEAKLLVAQRPHSNLSSKLANISLHRSIKATEECSYEEQILLVL